MTKLAKALEEANKAREADKKARDASLSERTATADKAAEAAAKKATDAEARALQLQADGQRLEVKVNHLEEQLNLTRQQAQASLERNAKLQEKLREADERPSLDPDMPLAIEDLNGQVRELKKTLEDKSSEAEARGRRVDDLELSLKQAQEEGATQQRAQQHENRVFSETRLRMQADLDQAKSKLSSVSRELDDAASEHQVLRAKVDELTASKLRAAEDNANLRAQLEAANEANQQTAKIAGEHERQQRAAQGRQREAEEEAARLKSELRTTQAEIQSLNNALASARENARMYREQAMGNSAADTSSAERKVAEAHKRVSELEAQLGATKAQVHSLMSMKAEGGGGPKGGDMTEMRARLVRSRDVLLAKLIGNWQKQTMGRSFAAWLRSIEAFKMDRILMESDKYMSMDSSIDDLLNDALSKRRARSIVASSASLGGSRCCCRPHAFDTPRNCARIRLSRCLSSRTRFASRTA